MTDYRPENVDGSFLVYRDKPLVRHGNWLVYGDLSEKYALYLVIVSTKKVTVEGREEEVPNGVMVQIMSTDESKPITERLVKQSMETGLYNALDLGIEWLNSYNNG